MLLELWPQLSGLVQNQREHRKLPGLIVNRQLEAIRKQGLHHESKLVLGRIAGCARLDVISIGIRPFRQLRLDGLTLVRRKLVRKNHVLNQREIRCGKQASGRSEKILRTQRNVSDVCALERTVRFTDATSNAILPPASICHWGIGGEATGVEPVAVAGSAHLRQ